MRITSLGVAAAALATIPLLSGSRASPTPADQFAGIAKAYLSVSFPPDWEGIEKLPGTKWARATTCLAQELSAERRLLRPTGQRHRRRAEHDGGSDWCPDHGRPPALPEHVCAVGRIRGRGCARAGRLHGRTGSVPDQGRHRRHQLVSAQGHRPDDGLPLDPAGRGRQAQRGVRARAGRGTTGPAAQPAGPLHRAVHGRSPTDTGLHDQAARATGRGHRGAAGAGEWSGALRLQDPDHPANRHRLDRRCAEADKTSPSRTIPIPSR